MIITVLTSLFDEMQKAGMSSTLLFRAGLSATDISRLEEEYGIVLHPDIRECYLFRDGLVNDLYSMNCWYYKYFRWLPLREAMEAYEDFNENLYEVLEIDQTFFPILEGTCDYIAVLNDPQLKPEVFSYDPASGITKRYLDLETMFATHLRCWQQGIFTIADGLMTVSSRETEVSRAMNPRCDFWG